MIFFISTPPHYRKSSNGLIFASKRGGPSLRLIKRNVPGEYNLTFVPPPPLRGWEKKSKISNQGREFKTYKEKEG